MSDGILEKQSNWEDCDALFRILAQRVVEHVREGNEITPDDLIGALFVYAIVVGKRSGENVDAMCDRLENMWYGFEQSETRKISNN